MSDDRFRGVMRRSAPQHPEHVYAMERRDYRKRVIALQWGWALFLGIGAVGALVWAVTELLGGNR